MDPARLLVVEDDPVSAAVLRRMLERDGHRVESASDGEAALQILAADPAFDAVLLDRGMPKLDGMQVLRRMKEIEALEGIPVVFQTALVSDSEIREGLDAGAFYYLAKPLDARLVVSVVAAAVADHRARRRAWSELKGIRGAMGLVLRGTFAFRTLAQCHDLSALLARTCPDPRKAVVGLSELMINALEHGNLGISYAEKTALVESRTWNEEVQRRQELPENREKWVTVDLRRTGRAVRFRIADQGEGFPWRDFQELNPQRMFDNHGRGILLAKWEAFTKVRYVGKGNVVVAEVEGGEAG